MFRARLVARLVMDVSVPDTESVICYSRKLELSRDGEGGGRVHHGAESHVAQFMNSRPKVKLLNRIVCANLLQHGGKRPPVSHLLRCA